MGGNGISARELMGPGLTKFFLLYPHTGDDSAVLRDSNTRHATCLFISELLRDPSFKAPDMFAKRMHEIFWSDLVSAKQLACSSN